jgi:glutamate-1-semialdehyde 2,1-aminomutase
MDAKTFTGYNLTWQNRAELTIAQGALTNSKRPECLVKGIFPTHLTRGQGAFVWDTSGKRYIDFICGLGANLLGYGQSEIASVVAQRAAMGATLSLATTLEVETAEKVRELFPLMERLKFLKNGSDACTAALRIARAYRKRATVLSEGYHGFHDEFVSLVPPALGVVGEFPIESLKDLSDIDESIAAVIIEPVMTDLSPKRIQFLKELREVCTKTGVILIYDEVITGCRFPKWSTARYIGIEPDLICIGKAMGNGMPISAVGGKAEIMNCGEYFISSTFAGETLSLAAAHKTLSLLQTKFSIEMLWERGDQFLKAFNSIAPQVVRIQGYPTRGVFVGSDLNKALFWQEACKAGILFGPSWFFNFSHLAHVDLVLSSCQDILRRIQVGAVSLEGELPQTPFAQKMRKA